MFDWVPGDSVNCFYFALVIIGLLWTLISLVGADLGGDVDVDVGGPDFDFHIGDFDVAGVHVPEIDIGMDSPDVDVGGGLEFPSISPFSIASFITGFGAAGIIANLAFHVSAAISLVWAMLGGLVAGGVMQFVFAGLLLKSQGSSEVRLSQLGGLIAEVTVPIPPGGNGQIAFVARGRRVTFTARAVGDEGISRGAQVEIVRMVGGSAVVQPVEEE